MNNTVKAKSRNYRRKPPIVRNINLETIKGELYDIQEECYNVQYYIETDNDSLINALDGDEDEAMEFKVMFSDLCADCERMAEDLENEYIPECFDDFFVAIGAAEYGGGLLGFDECVQDYYGISLPCWGEENEASKRLMRLTKEQLLMAANICIKVFYSYVGLQDRYNSLKAAMDILKDQNTDYLKTVKNIEELYEEANTYGFEFYGNKAAQELDRVAKSLPDEAWLC